MKILLLGGTGAMGRHLIKVLCQDHEIVVTSRTPPPPSGTVRYVSGDARNEHFLGELLKDRWDAIVDFMVYSTAEFRNRHKLLLGSTDQYVFLSSSRVYAESETPLTEDSPRLLDVSQDKAYLATDEYALSKARQENILFGSPGKNWTIVRPYITFDTYRLQLGVLEKEQWLHRALSGKKIVFPREIADRTTTITHGLDVARSIRAFLGNPNAFGEAFHTTSSHAFQWKDALAVYLELLEAHTGRRPEIHWPSIRDFTSCWQVPYQITYDRLFDRRFDNTKLSGFIDTNTFMPPLEALRQCCLEFLQKPKFLGIKWSQEALLDRLSGERTPLQQITGLNQKARYFYFRNLCSLEKS